MSQKIQGQSKVPKAGGRVSLGLSQTVHSRLAPCTNSQMHQRSGGAPATQDVITAQLRNVLIERLQAECYDPSEVKFDKWIENMKIDQCDCGLQGYHCCPVSVLNGELCDVHPQCQLGFFAEAKRTGVLIENNLYNRKANWVRAQQVQLQPKVCNVAVQCEPVRPLQCEMAMQCDLQCAIAAQEVSARTPVPLSKSVVNPGSQSQGVCVKKKQTARRREGRKKLKLKRSAEHSVVDSTMQVDSQ